MSAPVTAVAPHWSFLLAACSAVSVPQRGNGKLPHDDSLSWKALFELADQQGVMPLLYRALSSANGTIPGDQMQKLSRLYQTNLHKSLILARELIRILDALNDAGLEALPYKGVTVAETIYGDIALRQSGDIDLLVRPSEFQRVKEVVCQLGYTPHGQLSPEAEKAYLSSGYECTFDGPAGRNLLELQWALQPRFYSVDLNVADLFERAVSVTVAGRNFKTLSPEDLLIVLSLHAAKHRWSRLIWICDIARILGLPKLNWQQIAHQARVLGVVRILSITFLLANKLLGSEVPAAALQSLPADSEANIIAGEAEMRLLSGIVCDTESSAYFRLMLRLRERRSDQMRFLRRLAFTPGPGEWKTVRLPAPLFPLYHVVRISRLAAKFARLGP